MSAGERRGHLLALFTIVVWGTTFLSTSVLLRDFTPLEILIIRMALGIAALTVARPRRSPADMERPPCFRHGAHAYGLLSNGTMIPQARQWGKQIQKI